MKAELEEIRASLEVLGLDSGAEPTEIRSAFRRLVRASHPDAAGRDEAQFQRIMRAYSLLRKLSPEDIQAVGPPSEGRQQEKRLDRVLEQYTQSVTRRLERLEREEDQGLIDGLLLRLRSPVRSVRCLALARVGVLANREEIRATLTDLLCRWDVDEETARLVAALPLKPEERRRLARDVASRAALLPDSLIASLLNLRRSEKMDPALLERYLSSVRPSSAAPLLRHWPRGRPLSDALVRRLLEVEDPAVLVPLLSAMKQDFPQAAARHRRRLAELQQHPASPVRVWSRALLSETLSQGVSS